MMLCIMTIIVANWLVVVANWLTVAALPSAITDIWWRKDASSLPCCTYISAIVF
jgi:hypothetical protein